jgi:hypothetical protein
MRPATRLWSLSLIVACSLYAGGFWLVSPLSVPDPEDTRAAGEHIRAHFAPGDAVATLPWWAARLRETVGDLPWVQARDLAGEDLSRHARLWVWVHPGHEDELFGPFASGTYTIEERREFGRGTLLRYRLPEPARVLYDFRERLFEARVRMIANGTPLPCSRWDQDRWICTPRDWNYVGRMIVELGDDPREIIWAHPSDEGPIEVAYGNVPHGTTLRVHTGFTPPAARAKDGAPVTLEVEVDGRPAARIVQENRTGFFGSDVDLAPFGEGPHAVVFRVSTARAGMRHFCFTAEVRR